MKNNLVKINRIVHDDVAVTIYWMDDTKTVIQKEKANFPNMKNYLILGEKTND